MALSTHKFPIIPTINDQPSVAGQEEHPNASLLCKNFNDLIDELDTSVTTLDTEVTTLNTKVTALVASGGSPNNTPHSDGFTVYVKFIGGNDTLDGLTVGNAVATIQKAIDIIAVKPILNSAIIKIDGIYTQTKSLDFSKLRGIASSVLSNFQNTSTIILDAQSTSWNFIYSSQVNSLLISSATVQIKFSKTIFTCNKTLLLRNLFDVAFSNCTFNTNTVANENSSGIILASGGLQSFFNCTFTKSNNCLIGINLEKFANAIIETCTFNTLDTAINATYGSRAIHKGGTFTGCRLSFKGSDGGSIQTSTTPTLTQMQMETGSVCIVSEKVYTKVNNNPPAVDVPNYDADLGFVIDTIQNLLIALERHGILLRAFP